MRSGLNNICIDLRIFKGDKYVNFMSEAALSACFSNKCDTYLCFEHPVFVHEEDVKVGENWIEPRHSCKQKPWSRILF